MDQSEGLVGMLASSGVNQDERSSPQRVMYRTLPPGQGRQFKVRFILKL